MYQTKTFPILLNLLAKESNKLSTKTTAWFAKCMHIILGGNDIHVD